MAKIVEFIPNFSEGRRQEVIDAISEAARSVKGAKLINVTLKPLTTVAYTQSSANPKLFWKLGSVCAKKPSN